MGNSVGIKAFTETAKQMPCDDAGGKGRDKSDAEYVSGACLGKTHKIAPLVYRPQRASQA